MTYANVTPVTAITLPFQWTVAGVNYIFSSAQGSGCTDTVTPVTANAGGTFNVKGVPLYPSQAYQIIMDFDAHQSGGAVPCQSLLNQINYGGSASVTSGGLTDYFPQLGMGAVVDDVVALIIAGLVIVYVVVPVLEALGWKRK